MVKFTRTLNEDLFARKVTAKSENWWFGELLERWKPAGSEGPGLRIGIRDGYMNFYSFGQSVAKVTFQKKGFRADVHEKYLMENPRDGQHYLKLSDPNVLPEDQGGGIDKWIERSAKYRGAEKFFVEQVVSQNGAVIDLEMALPGFRVTNNAGTIHLVAPRIDLVALEEIDGKYRVVFWEAKRIGDSRIRSNSDHPEVLTQIENYRKWMEGENRKNEVLTAYHQACRLLVKLHDYATGEMNLQLPDLDKAIVSVAKDRSLLVEVDTELRLLVSAEVDKGLLPEKDKKGNLIQGRTREQQDIDNGHIKTLVNNGKLVHVVSTVDHLRLPHRADVKNRI